MLLGTVFSFIGLTACVIAALRHRGAARLLIWFGLFIGLYGARMLAHVTDVLQLAPQSPWPARWEIGVNYVLVIPALLFWAELSNSYLRRCCQILALVAAGIATLGLGRYLISGSPDALLRYNFLIAICAMVALGILVIFPGFVRKHFTIQSRILRIVMPAMALVVLFVNVRLFLGHPPARYIEPITFAVWISAIGYEAAKHTFDNEKRLLSIESELETARQIQSSLLPETVPAVVGLRIAASYEPMSAVAGDFYQFLQLDDRRVGVLVADVTGHGVPAALIASMIKVAMQSIVVFAQDPAQVLRNLNRILTPELRGRLTSAAYLWIDSENCSASYSAAGHPALLQWSAARSELLHVESNGLLFGVAGACEYPVRNLPLEAGDRFLLYTDGLVDPENAHGESFGDRQLEHILGGNRELPAPELSRKMLSSLQAWQPASLSQQDDITLVVVDVL